MNTEAKIIEGSIVSEHKGEGRKYLLHLNSVTREVSVREAVGWNQYLLHGKLGFGKTNLEVGERSFFKSECVLHYDNEAVHGYGSNKLLDLLRPAYGRKERKALESSRFELTKNYILSEAIEPTRFLEHMKRMQHDAERLLERYIPPHDLIHAYKRHDEFGYAGAGFVLVRNGYGIYNITTEYVSRRA